MKDDKELKQSTRYLPGFNEIIRRINYQRDCKPCGKSFNELMESLNER